MRVGIGGISHESSTFTPVATTFDNYRSFYLVRGDELVDAFAGTNTPIGGFLEETARAGIDVVPTMFAEALPSAPTPRAVFDELLGELTERLGGALPLDGVLLDLHGAMVAEGIDDCEGKILESVRAVIGPETPIVVQLDIHANVSKRMIAAADVLIGRDTYPEIDMAERGRECVSVLARIVNSGLRPALAYCSLPMLWGQRQETSHEPMRGAIEKLHRIEQRPGIVCASIATCFPWADVPAMGASVYVVSDVDEELAQTTADELGAWIYERRADWQADLPRTADVLHTLNAATRFPLVLADRADNPGAGTPGDSTGMLHAFVEHDLHDACLLYLVDPVSARLCHDAGVGARIDLELGGRSSPDQGRPVAAAFEILALSNGRVPYDGPMYAGLEMDLGATARVRLRGVEVVVVSERHQPYDGALSRSLGMDLPRMRVIGVKSQTHFRAGFEPWAGTIVAVGEPSVHAPASGALAYRHLGRRLYPIDRDPDPTLTR